MGLEQLIGYLGATWFMSAREKEEQRRQAAAASAMVIADMNRETSVLKYIAAQGFDRARQRKLEALASSPEQEDQDEVTKLLGRPYCKTDVAIARAIRAIADKEGWRYYDEDMLVYDPEYCRLKGWPPVDQETIDAVKKRRDRERRNEARWLGWVERNPGCFDFDVSPEYYDNEEKFALGIDAAHRKWCKITFNDFGVKPGNYKTKAAYERALEERKKELLDYQEAMDLLGITPGIGTSSFCMTIDRLKAEVGCRPEKVPLEIFFYLAYITHCVPCFGGPMRSWELENFHVLRVLARQKGVDLDEVLEKAEKGILLPKGAKLLSNRYLSRYVLTGSGDVYTLRPSSYYYKQFGFTIEEFEKHCGKNPGDYFAPPVKGLPK